MALNKQTAEIVRRDVNFHGAHLSFSDPRVELGAAPRACQNFEMLFRPAWAFVYRFFLRLGFLDGLPGFLMATNHSFTVFLKYARLWEKGLDVDPPPDAPRDLETPARDEVVAGARPSGGK